MSNLQYWHNRLVLAKLDMKKCQGGPEWLLSLARERYESLSRRYAQELNK